MSTTAVKDYSKVASHAAISRTVSALEANGFIVSVVDSAEAAKSRVLELIPEGSEVLTNTSRTIEKIGLDTVLNEAPYVSVRNKFMPLYGQPEKAVEMHRIGSGAEYAIGSVHAITEDGQVLIASATGSQLPSYAYGANHVVWVVGGQKIVEDLNDAFQRLEQYTFPLEDERAMEAYGVHSSINKVLIYRKEPAQRIHIVIVKESIGF